MAIDAVPAHEAAGRIPRVVAQPPGPPPAGGRTAPAGGKELPPASRPPVSDVHLAAELIDQFLRAAGRVLAFSVDHVTGRTVVSVRDPATGELIRQMPSEEALRIARNLEVEGAALVDELA